jgi:peptide deformylase
MASLPIRYEPDPILRAKAKRVRQFDPTLRRLAAEMFATMRAENGVGLAAPQVGQSIRLLVAEFEPGEDEKKEAAFKVALVNPEIVKRSEEMADGYEGCLSIPGWIGEVPRHVSVTVKAQSVEGKEIRLKANDYFARVLQHEIDHLDGILFTDRIVNIKSLQRVEEDELTEEQEKVLEV